MEECWWHYAVTLPLHPNEHAYHVLRRVWADHTMQPPRGFWALGSEDHVTTVLFQPLAAMSNTLWLDRLLVAAGLPTVSAKEVRFAFACEEVLDAPLLSRHGRNFVIADIMLHWRGQSSGLVAFEVKKPGGVMPSAQDVTKLQTYSMLPSTRQLPHRCGVFLVDDRHVAALKRSGHAAVGWSMVHLAIMESLDQENGPPEDIAEIASGLSGLFRKAGVLPRKFPIPRGKNGQLAPRLAALKAGLQVRESILRKEIPDPPYDWLAIEPTRKEISTICPQSTAQRRINRWSLDWTPSDESL